MWLAKPPRNARELFFRTEADAGEPVVQLGTWAVEEVVPELAVEVLGLLDAHVEATRATVTARLSYVDEAGNPIKVKVLQRQSAHVESPEALGDVTLDGSKNSQVVQAQAFAQASVQQLLRSNAVVLQQAVAMSQHGSNVTQMLYEQLVHAQKRAERAELECEQMKRELARVLATAEGEAGEGEGALARLLEPHLPVLLPMLQVVVARAAGGLMGPGTPTQG
jgi:hypothetical protein